MQRRVHFWRFVNYNYNQFNHSDFIDKKYKITLLFSVLKVYDPESRQHEDATCSAASQISLPERSSGRTTADPCVRNAEECI